MPRPKPPMPDELQAGIEAYKNKDYKKAQKHFEKALSLKPAVDLYNNLALTYLQLGKTKEAEKTLKEGLALNPQYVPFYDNLSRLYVLQERFGEAMKLLEDGKMLTNNPEFDYKILVLKRMLFGQSFGD
ncbi:MAG TPA: tetratricopeptide repeat protein [Candidatus Nanoarchaeia archaeon]|nr:tetratricopeptide repeat protein [Candidatus Nanoarchaeia archaeon]